MKRVRRYFRPKNQFAALATIMVNISPTVNVKKQPKDVDSATQTRFLMIAVRLAPAGALLGWVIGGLQGVLYGLTISVLAVFAVELLSGGIGNGSVNILYGTGRLDRTMRDQFINSNDRNRLLHNKQLVFIIRHAQRGTQYACCCTACR